MLNMVSHSGITDFKLIQSDIDALEKTINSHLDSNVSLVKEVVQYILSGGGKKLRSKVLMLMAGVFSYVGKQHITLAAIVEFIHIATLLHDDVVDQSDLRRGKTTANHQFGNSAAVLVGDFLFSRAFQMMVNIDNKKILSILADATNTISEGEVLQLMHCADDSITIEDYFRIIDKKTAVLFQATCWLASELTDASEDEIKSAKKYGKKLGIAFQIIDDLLDYVSDEKTLGKSLGDDLKEGKITLPLIIVLEQGSDHDKKIIRSAIAKPDNLSFEKTYQILEKNDAINKCRLMAKEIINDAVQQCQKLPQNEYTTMLETVANQSLNRLY